MNYYAANMETLRRRNPGLATAIDKLEPGAAFIPEQARNGECTVKINGQYLHSSHNPSREAGTWVDKIAAHETGGSRRRVVLGFGLGYHLQALLARGFKGTVIEGDPQLVRFAMENNDLTAVIDSFELLVGLAPEWLHRAHGDILAGTVFSHPASLRAEPAYLGGLHAYAGALKAARAGGLKILLVNPISGGSLPIARYCASALKNLGHLVTTFAAEAFSKGMDLADGLRFGHCRTTFRSELATAISRGVELMAKETRPDLVLALAQAPLIPETLARLAGMGIATAFWFVEDYRVLTYWRLLAPAYGHIFGIQKDNFRKELAAIGVENYHYLPTAAAPEIHLPIPLSREEQEMYGSSLSFVGASYYNRLNLFRGLTDYQFKIWGSGWPLAPPLDRLIQLDGARIDTETCVRIFNAATVNLNLHSSQTHEGVVPDGDFVNPRTFEIASCGAFQLTDRRTLLGELFAEGEIELFSDLAELREKIDSYLARPDERMRVARLGRERVLAEHTYIGRMEELLAVILAEEKEMAEKHRFRLAEQERRREGLDRQEGLRELLDRLPPDASPTLEDIYGTVREGEGKLSRAEKIFLALKNVEMKLD
ncbi:MAG TPA: glycosyltransferase [Geobacteraceae bacterium]|nr:glycosyltransferase [Geobacteraceae bacterium]